MKSTPSDASYAVEVARLLWPEPWAAPSVSRSRQPHVGVHRDAYLFPSERRARLLVPVDVPASSSMVRRLGSSHSALASPMRGLLERAVRSRAFGLARWPVLRVATGSPGAESIETHLAGVFGTQVRVGVLLGTRRVNQKPVLQVFDLAGALLGYAKVGHNELTAALVRHEADALARVGRAEPTTFRVPTVLDCGDWAGLEVLVISALASDPRTAVTAEARVDAMRELARLTGSLRSPLAGSAFWSRLRTEASRLSDQPEGDALATAVMRIEQGFGSDLLELGAWHGDWGQWNMGDDHGVLQLWDWERFDPEVPVGFDGVHYLAQSVRPGAKDQRRQENAFYESLPRTLAELGVHHDQHDLTLVLYLLEISTRYVAALTYGATPALSRRTAWTISELQRLLEQEQPALAKGHS